MARTGHVPAGAWCRRKSGGHGGRVLGIGQHLLLKLQGVHRSGSTPDTAVRAARDHSSKDGSIRLEMFRRRICSPLLDGRGPEQALVFARLRAPVLFGGFDLGAESLRHPVTKIIAVVALMPVALETRPDTRDQASVKLEPFDFAFELAERRQIV